MLTYAQPQTHMPLIIKKTATWCPYCGGWGWELQKELEERNDKNVVILQVHSSEASELYNSAAKELLDSLPVAAAIPFWYVNGERCFDYHISVNMNRALINQQIDSTFDEPALAGIAYEFDLHGDTLDVETTVEFFEDTSGIFYLSAWIVEDGVYAFQNGLENEEPYHSHVLRGSMTPSVFGEVCADGLIQADDLYKNSFSMLLDTGYRLHQTYLAFAIWKLESGGYKFINAYKNSETLGKPRILELTGELPHPNPTTGKVFILNQKLYGETTVSVYDTFGRFLFEEKFEILTHEIDLSRYRSGMYLFKIKSGSNQSVVRIIKK